MNNVKVNTIKFLMNMFEASCDTRQAVAEFKIRLRGLVRRNQITMDIEDILLTIYGIKNTDIFKSNLQMDKLTQISYLMDLYESGYGDTKKVAFMTLVNNGVKNDRILKSARDCVFRIYDLDRIVNSNNSNNSNHNNLDKSTNRIPDKTRLSSNLNSKKVPNKTPAVLMDISKIRDEYLDFIYYRYKNPDYDGCCGSALYIYTKLTEATSKPAGAVLVYQNTQFNDGCSSRVVYDDLTSEMLKSTVSTVSTSAYDPCRGGSGVGGRVC